MTVQNLFFCTKFICTFFFYSMLVLKVAIFAGQFVSKRLQLLMAGNGFASWLCINEGAVKSTLIAKEIKQVIAFECLIGWSGGRREGGGSKSHGPLTSQFNPIVLTGLLCFQ